MKSLTSVAAVVLVCFFQISLLPICHCGRASPPTGANLIEETCLKTPKPKLCEDSLNSVHQSAGADVKGLSKIMNGVVLMNKAQEVQIKIDLLIKDGTRPQAIFTCEKNYNVIVDDKIKAVNEGLNDHQLSKAEEAMDGAVYLLNDCNMALKDHLPGIFLIGMNTNVADLATVTKAIVKQLP